jgi:hypothetical protein
LCCGLGLERRPIRFSVYIEKRSSQQAPARESRPRAPNPRRRPPNPCQNRAAPWTAAAYCTSAGAAANYWPAAAAAAGPGGRRPSSFRFLSSCLRLRQALGAGVPQGSHQQQHLKMTSSSSDGKCHASSLCSPLPCFVLRLCALPSPACYSSSFFLSSA